MSPLFSPFMQTDAKFNIPSVLVSITFSVLAIPALTRTQSEQLGVTGEKIFRVQNSRLVQSSLLLHHLKLVVRFHWQHMYWKHAPLPPEQLSVVKRKTIFSLFSQNTTLVLIEFFFIEFPSLQMQIWKYRNFSALSFSHLSIYNLKPTSSGI